MKHDSDTKSLAQTLLFRFKLFIDWVKAGDLPPKTHHKSLCLMLFLVIIGSILGACFVLSHFNIALYDVFPVSWPLFGMSFITLGPGLYILFVALCCWRRVKGYGWWMIPYVENFW